MAKLAATPRRWLVTRGTIWVPDAALAGWRHMTRGHSESSSRRLVMVVMLVDNDMLPRGGPVPLSDGRSGGSADAGADHGAVAHAEIVS